jgi:uncharacterized Ntn-hydrolase superfamily protein
MTFSIAGYCQRTGRFGISVSSSSPAVAARCAYVRAGIGAACSQNITDPRLGERLLDLLAQGESADEAMAQVVNETLQIQYRQLSVVDGHGGSTAFSGERVLGTYDIARASYVATAGNLLKDQTIPARMVAAFEEKPESDLEDRLLSAMKTARSLGGEEGPVHSAGLKIAGSVPWPETDLRVDWSDDPIAHLAALWRLWRPQAQDYVNRAINPTLAPTYGVPGDE